MMADYGLLWRSEAIVARGFYMKNGTIFCEKKTGVFTCGLMIAGLILCGISGVLSSANAAKIEPVAVADKTMVLAPGKLPQYEIGTKYIYSDGSWERVEKKGQGWITWMNWQGDSFTASIDFTYKPFRWQTKTRQGSRTFSHVKYLFDSQVSTLWPLSPGNKTHFEEKGVWQGWQKVSSEYEAYWRCKVDGTERIEVAAGTFDTWKVTCARYPSVTSYPSAAAREYKTWYYAPLVGHWVEVIEDNNGFVPNTRRELVAILPDLVELTGDKKYLTQIQNQFQEVLEKNRSGQTDLWMSSGNAYSASLTPVATFRRPGGTICRQYTQQIKGNSGLKNFAGIACRNTEGIWQVPRQ
jgi:hypothetical protein